MTTSTNATKSIDDWLDNLASDQVQLNLDFSDNMTYGSMAQPALTISAVGVDTINLSSISGPTGAIGSSYSNITYGSGTGGTGGGYYAQPITITPNTILTSGTSGLNWGDLSNINPGGHSLEVKGDANFEGDVRIKGKSLIDSLEKIEEKLAILRPNEKLEEKWEDLRELRKKYMELEKEIIEKEKMWEILKR